MHYRGIVSVPGATTSVSRPPRVVLFRANSMDSDSRAKKTSLTLARLGYEVYALSAEEPGSKVGVRMLGDPADPDGPRVTVLPVPIGSSHRDVHRHRLAARRRRQFRFIDWTTQDEYVTRVRELRTAVRAARRAAVGALRPDDAQEQAGARAPGTGRTSRTQAGQTGTPGRRPVQAGYWAVRYALARLRLTLRMLRWRAQWTVNVSHRLAWRRWDAARQRRSLLATTRGTLPELEDYAAAFAAVLDELEPDIIHAHHPLVLGTAVRAARRRRAAGHRCLVVYDAREDFLGIPQQEQGHWRRHSALVREEARNIGAADAVLTVSEPITETLAGRYRLARRPALVLNVPVDDPRIRPGAVDGPTVREAAGLAAGMPLLVYGGAVSRARGIEVLVDALPHLPGVHAAVIAVPHPHPLAVELTARAVSLEVGDRLHFCPPVDQDHLLHYLSGADVAVMPLRTGSANIEQALPNKLFENLHAGLTMVTSDARLMAAFVREHDLGEVFSFHGPDGGAADLAAAARRALANPRDSHGEHWEALRRTYSWQGQEAALREVYAALVPPPRPHGIDDPTFCSLTLRPASVSLPPAGWVPTAALDGVQQPAAATVVSPARGTREVVEERST